jgi:ABC-type microcin C transport system permease subunit YejB
VYAGRRFIPDLLRKPIPYGLAYGLWIYLFMNWVVLPLDAMHTKPHFAPLDTWLTGLAIHMLGIGLSISLCASKTAPRA